MQSICTRWIARNVSATSKLEVRRVLPPFIDHRSDPPQAWCSAPLYTLTCGPVFATRFSESRRKAKLAVDVVQPSSILGLPSEHDHFCGRQHAVQPPQHRQRQDVVLVLALPEGVAYEVGYIPMKLTIWLWFIVPASGFRDFRSCSKAATGAYWRPGTQG